jgi:Rha family phage regulatory protein
MIEDKTKVGLTPLDLNRCQAEHTDPNWSFMTLGPAVMVRCNKKPVYIATENKLNVRDGLTGSMTLCQQCKDVCVKRMGIDYASYKLIKNNKKEKKRMSEKPKQLEITFPENAYDRLLLGEYSMEDVNSMQPGEILQMGMTIPIRGAGPMCHSLRLAQDFNVKHKNLLATIRKYATDEELAELNFQPCTYQDTQGRSRPAYLLGKDAFTFVTLSKTGAKSHKFRIRYIQSFNSIQRILSGSSVANGGLSSGDPVTQSLSTIREMADLALASHTKAQNLQLQVDEAQAMLSAVQKDLQDALQMFKEQGGQSLPLVAQAPGADDSWHGGPYFVDDLRKLGFMSTDDIPRRKPQYFPGGEGVVAKHAEILDFIREQFHVGRSTHANPMLRMDTIRQGWAGVFGVNCPKPKPEPPGYVAKAIVRPMVFMTPYGVEELVKRWAKRQKVKMVDLV